MLEGLPGEQGGIVAAGGEGHDLEAVRVRGNDLEGLGADRARGTENGDTLSHVAILSHPWCLAYFTSERRTAQTPIANGMTSQIMPETPS